MYNNDYSNYQDSPNYWSDEAFESSPLYFESIRVMLGDREGVLCEEEVGLILEAAEREMSAAEFKFLKKIVKKVGHGIKNFGRGAVKFGKKALPVIGRLAQIAAPIVGGALGGPTGAMVGNTISQGIGALMGGGAPPATVPPGTYPGTPPTVPQNSLLAGATQLLGKGQPATNQLLGLLQNPALMQSLVGQVLGGRGTVSMATPTRGGTSKVPFGAIMNLLGQLSTQAAIEAEELESDRPTYLYDDAGEFSIQNPSSARERAGLLQEILYNNTLENYWLPDERVSQHDPLTEWFQTAKMIY